LNIYTTLEDRKKANAWRNQYYDKLKQNKLNQPSALVGNTLNGTAAAVPSSSGSGSSKSGGSKSSATTSGKTAGVFDNIKLPYEDTVAQKNAQKAADLKRQQEQYNAQKLAEKQAAEAKAAQEKYAREKYIAQMRQKQIDDRLMGTGMRSNPYTGTVKTPSANTQSQWKTGGNEQNKAYSNTGPNREMANTVKLNTPKPAAISTPKPAVTTPKTVVSTVKPTGPNVQMGSITQSANKPLTRAQLEKLVYGMTGGVGPSRETSQTRLEGNPESLYKAVEDLQNNHGINKETARTNHLDPRGQNITDKIISDITNEINMVRYGADYLNDENHTNTVVSKDNVYSLPPQTVSSELRKAQENVTVLKNDKKQQRDELLFQKNMAYIKGFDSRDTSALDSQIKHLDSEIAMLNIKEMKNNIGYEFCQNYIKMLSEANRDDILKIINEYNHLPYFGNIANMARSAKGGVGKVKDVVSVLDETKVSSFERSKGFRVFTKSEPKNGFVVIPDYTVDNYGFRDYKLSVTADNIDALTPDQKNLYKTLDNMPISEEVYDYLGKLPKVLNDFDAGKAGRGLTAIGYVLDVVDFLCLVATDYDSTTDTVSKDTTRKVTSMITSWIGGLAGAELGAAGGAAIGTAILPGVGTVVGGAIGAIVGAYILSEAGEEAGMYLGGIDYDTGTTIEYHLERGR